MLRRSDLPHGGNRGEPCPSVFILKTPWTGEASKVRITWSQQAGFVKTAQDVGPGRSRFHRSVRETFSFTERNARPRRVTTHVGSVCPDRPGRLHKGTTAGTRRADVIDASSERAGRPSALQGGRRNERRQPHAAGYSAFAGAASATGQRCPHANSDTVTPDRVDLRSSAVRRLRRPGFCPAPEDRKNARPPGPRNTSAR